eukprot:3941940-Rhodomonas_salina.1
MPRPVLTHAVQPPIVLRACYAMPSTDRAYAATAMCGTPYEMSGTDIRDRATVLLHPPVLTPRKVLRACYAMRGAYSVSYTHLTLPTICSV